MTTQEMIERLLAVGDPASQQTLLQAIAAQRNGTAAAVLKAEADRLLRADVRRSLEVARLMQDLGAWTGNPLDQALGLLAEANARSIGLGEYQPAIALYEEAAAIYASEGLPMEQARAQVGKVGALSFLGRYTEADQAGQWASELLEAHAQWQPLATLLMNLAIMHARMGEDAQALDLFDRAGELYATLGETGRAGWLWVQLNRAFVLRNLGQFAASMAACRTAQEELSAMGQTVAAARAQQNLALTHFILGQYNEALKGLDQVREVFVADGRQRDAMLVDLFVSNCLLQLRRYHDVLETCRQVRSLFTELGAHDVAAKAILNEGVSYAGLGQYDAAIGSLEEARSIFAQIGNHAWTASAELEIAAVLRFCGDLERSLAMARRCSQLFRQLQLPVEEAQSYLIAARAALRLARVEEAGELADQALAIGQSMDIASLIYQAHHLLGRVAGQQGQQEQALEAYGAAIEHLERLRGRLMVEFRADFLEDKTAVYEDMVLLCVALDRALSGLEYVERAKSRALVEMLAFRLDVSIEARAPEDTAHVDELMRLRSQRDQMYRRWQGKDELKARGAPAVSGGWEQIEQEVLEIENRITKLWHKLLVRNADYARDAALWRVQIEPIQPYLDDETVLIEYFVARDVMLAFVVTRQSIEAVVLPIDLKTLQNLYRLLRLNLDAAPHSTAARLTALTANAQALLHRLYQGLVAPLDATLRAYARWIVVPYGPLHYLPFQALFDGVEYLIERHEISYLPGASLLRFCQEPRQGAAGAATFGHSFGGQLPNTVHEAAAIHAIFGGDLYVEEEATPARFRELASQRQVLHLATHGNFRPDNPLFSGLALADGWLTTLDIFNLRLNASLVTLSACQTGRSTVGGGDELLGLMRALLYAGAASLVLTLWTVEDRSTAGLMQRFYLGLAQGQRKGNALRQAQLAFIQADQATPASENGAYAHPYFWAPFFLVGDAGAL
ncbi:MAG TPA: CHAT domain-containing tetratricopeptide repeat protein [Anaerolineae bacterium]|nr:CHAT domain-containing tetratricopeptide repeat protein [Anaerolineae bacterium]